MTDNDLIAAIQKGLPSVREKAHEVGSMSGLWDSILDFEALLDGKETLLRGTRRQKLLVIAGHFGIEGLPNE